MSNPLRLTGMTYCILLLPLISFATQIDEIPIPNHERAALIALYESTNGNNWKNKEKWMGKPGTECDWYGVSCTIEDDVTDGIKFHVDGLSLFENNLTGSLPPELGALPYLSILYMFNNKLSGRLPLEYDNLDKLKRLLIYGNHLSGKLPPKLLQRFDSGELYLVGYAGQFSPIVQIEFEHSPTGLLCGKYYAVLKSDRSASLKTKVCRMETPKDRATYWETKVGYISLPEFDRLARMIECSGFYDMEAEYSQLITHNVFETITVVHQDGKSVSVEDYANAAPMNFWFLKKAINGFLFDAEWEKTTRTEPEMN